MSDVHVDLSDLDWMRRGSCVGEPAEFWFPIAGRPSAQITEEAKRICAGCEVRSECLDYAMRNGEHYGTWGGMTVAERRRLRRKRSLSRRSVA